MASKALTTDVIALTEKKMNMTLDEIIKMSKNKQSQRRRPRRQPNKQGFQNGSASRANNRLHGYMDSRSTVRQGVLAQRRSKFQENQFDVTKETARKAIVVPIRRRPARWNNSRRVATAAPSNNTCGSFDTQGKEAANEKPQTLDARFANMKEQRTKVVSQQIWHGKGRQVAHQRNAQMQQRFRAAASNQRANHFPNFTRR